MWKGARHEDIISLQCRNEYRYYEIEQEAKARGLEASVDAIPMVELGDNLKETSIILLGPQIRFALDDIKKQAEGIPVMAIAAQDFGMMNAKKVLDEALKEL